MPLKYRFWEWIAVAAFATFAAYVAIEPALATADDCIDAVEILVFLPYYALLYFGTLPALAGVGVWRAVRGQKMNSQSRRTLDVSIGVLAVLLALEILAWIPSPYLTLADRSLDFMPSIVLALWVARLWLSARAPQGARS